MAHVPTAITDLVSGIPAKAARNVEDSYEMAKEIYGSRMHYCGEEYITHVVGVAQLMLPMHPGADVLIAALLHHARGKDELKMVEGKFGKDIRSMVASMSILDGSKSSTKSSADIQKMVLALSEDVRILIICLHDRLHSIRQAHFQDQKLRIKLAREILEVFAPLCARLGIYALKYELETDAFLILYPQEAKDIERAFGEIRQKRGDVLSAAQHSIKTLLRGEGFAYDITTRKKQPFSIFRKMNEKGITNMAGLYDLFGIRIIVNTVEDCYRVLGVLHRTYRPILHRIKDYIGMPKPNGYRSLHTTLLGLSKESPIMPAEVQIRTHEMDKEAEYGIASHWLYKEGGSNKPLLSSAWITRMKKLKNLSQGVSLNECEKEEMREAISDRIYVLTPKGDPIELRNGAIPLDFAFRIHSDIGLRFRMAKINGKIATIDQPLENGDVVEIMTRKDPCPSEQWISLCRTKDARSKLRSFFQRHPHKRALFSR